MENAEQIVSDLESYALTGNITSIMQLLTDKGKRLTMRDSRVLGIITLGQLKKAITESETVSNEMNREEELDKRTAYFNKLHHLIRFIDGISRKSHLQLSFIPSLDKKCLYISDDGTMMSLAIGQYSNKKIITGTELQDMLKDIESSYEVDTTRTIFINNINAWLNTLSDQEKFNIHYSWQDIVKKSESTEIFNQTKFLMEINLFNIQQHIKDQQNANLQPNPWVAHNFYKAFVKFLKEYKNNFIGHELMKLIKSVPGIGDNFNQQGRRLFRKFGQDIKKAELERPFYMIASALIGANEIDKVLDANKMFLRYNAHEDTEVGKYWYNRYKTLVKNVSYQDMNEFIENFKVVQESGDWGNIWDIIKDIEAKHNTTCKAFEELTPHKDDFAIYITYVILALHQMYPNAFSRSSHAENIRKMTIVMQEAISDKIKGDITVDDVSGSVVTGSVFEMFQRDGYTSWPSRFEYIWKPAIKSVHAQCVGHKVAESKTDKEIGHQKDCILRYIREENFPFTHTGYSHVGTELVTIKFDDRSNTSKTMAGLHCKPVTDGGTVENGLIWGLAADNGGEWKYENLNDKFDSPSDYWESLGNHNTGMLEKNQKDLSPMQRSNIKKFIELCYTLASRGINYKYKKSN
jgi:hypothetical protein